MDAVVNVYKEQGETPLERLGRLRAADPRFKDETLTYAGRLDPLAEGVMLVLVGDENKRRGSYLGLDKEYSFDVAFGVRTDTYDVLGIPRHSPFANVLGPAELRRSILAALRAFEGKIVEEYPPYSSKTVRGKPLFAWAREGRLGEIELPTKEVEVHSIRMTGFSAITPSDFKDKIGAMVRKVKGDFRQAEVLAAWDDFFRSADDPVFYVASFEASVSSGTYVRGIADALGKQLGTGAVALRILRSRVGSHLLKDSIR